MFEEGPGTGGSWEEIDYSETSFYVHTAENIDLEIVFVLDFTNSMAGARLSDGRSGIEAMRKAFEASLAVLPSAHRIGVVEFHDRNARPSVLSPLTTDRQAVLSNVEGFIASGFDSGSSRVWDSLVTAADLFSSREQNPRAVRALVFLSDGRDTSSDRTREQAAQYAVERGVQLYAVGVGDIFQEADLRSVARSTDGAYYSARDLNLIQEQFQLLVNDLRGQYQLTYITLRRTGEYRVGIGLELEGILGETQVGPFDVARFFGADNQGVVAFDSPSLDRENQRATVFMRTLHVPRNVDRIRFNVQTSKPLQVSLVPAKDGGLLEGWNLSGPDDDGWFEVSSGNPLEFGSLGLLANLTFSSVTEEGLEIPVDFDNSIYPGSKSLSHLQYLAIGHIVQRIVFESDRDDPDPSDDNRIRNIYVMNGDGSGLTRLTDSIGWDSQPRWSPDGQRIVFKSDRDDPDPNDDDRIRNIYVINADGSGETMLTDSATDNHTPRWSPDGQRLVFNSDRDGDFKIYVMNADGSGVTRLTDSVGRDSQPRWSPDGQRIVFESDRDDPDPNDDERIFNIYVMNADGSEVTRLTDNPAWDFKPRWSPDGQRIAFGSYRDDGDSDIYVMNADGSGEARLTDSPAHDFGPKWSPDGQRIVFTSRRHEREDPNGIIWSLYVINADGSGETRLTDHSAIDIDADWSPNGRLIAFVSIKASNEGTNREIYTVKPDGSGLSNLTVHPSSDQYPHWTGP